MDGYEEVLTNELTIQHNDSAWERSHIKIVLV